MFHAGRALTRAALLTGVSALALWTAAPASHARQLGGSGVVVAAPNFASDAATLAAQQAAAVAKQSASALTRATQAIQAMQATQNAARAAAQASQRSTTLPQVNVPNGLMPGGLVPDSGLAGNGVANAVTTWTGATTPTQSTDASGQTNVGIRQNAAQAILNWTSFNIGARTTLNFDQQGNASWVALNRVTAATAPSQILGNINAAGQVYVINQNGIIFGGNSQINVGSLIASSAGITDAQFLTNGIYSAQSGGSYLPNFTGAGGKIIVENGALITTSAPTSVTSGGGFVLLMGTEVDNAGSITTPKGQTELAAGDDFILRQGFGPTTNQTSTTRGNEIAPVLYPGSSSGAVDNTGLIFSQQGDITLAGHAITQDGILISTTSVNQRGTIHLLNSATDATGSVTLLGNALTLILPELDSTDTALDSQRDALIADSATQNAARAGAATAQFNNLSLLADREDQSRVEIVTGGIVDFQNGSLTMAQGGQVAVSAGQRVFAEAGSTLDVSGVQGVMLPMSANEIQVNIQGNELRDSPQNRDSGVLANKNVWIDVRDLILVPAGTGGYATDRYYTPGGLLEVSGYLSNSARTIGEWTALGGTITLSAPEVVAQQGSTFNISGGSVSYAGGDIYSTNLRGADGRIYSVDNAPADMTFIGLAGGFTRTHNISGQIDPALTEIWSNPFGKGATGVRYEAGYTIGRDAGQLILSTPTSVFEGDIIADVITGERQTAARPAGITDGYKLSQNTVPLAGTLALGQYDARGLIGAYATDVQFGDIAAVTTGMTAADALPTDRANTAWFDAPRLKGQGLGGLNVASTDKITVDAPIILAPDGQLTFAAPTIDISAGITAHGGSVTLGNIMSAVLAQGQVAQWWALTDANGKAQVTLASGITIDLSGLWTNALLDPSDLSGLGQLDGGNFTVATTGGITLASGSLVDVSSGGAILATGKTKGGKGGDVALLTNDYENLPVDFVNSTRTAPLVLGGDIRGYGFSGGGTLTINAAETLMIGDGSGADATLSLDPDFFRSGFAHYDITAAAGIIIGEGASIAPLVPVYRMTSDAFALPSGARLTDANLWVPPLAYYSVAGKNVINRVGADLRLATTRGDFSLAQGASITVDPGQAVNIYANGQTTIDGRITAPGGKILIASAQEATGELRDLGGYGSFSLTRSIWIGDDAVLDVSGRALVATDVRGNSVGTVLGGGSIMLGGTGAMGGVDPNKPIASDAFVIIRPGAVLDASGTSAALDVETGSLFTPGKSAMVASDGGLIALYSNNGIYIDGTIRAAAGGAGASGGTLSVSIISREYGAGIPSLDSQGTIGPVIPDEIQTLRNITLVQRQRASGLATDLEAGESSATLQFGNAVLSVDQIKAGGFASLSLYTTDLVRFEGDVNLSMSGSLNLAGGILSVSDATPLANVRLAAPYVRLDGWSDVDTFPPGTGGYYPGLAGIQGPSLQRPDSRLTIAADLIDIYGNVISSAHGGQGNGYLTPDPGSLVTAPIVDAAGFGNIVLDSTGDVRFGDSSITTGGNLTIKSAQLYPMSGASAVISVGQVLTANLGPVVYDPAAVLTIRGNGGAVPAMPASVFGNLTFVASTIDQGGVVRAPLGVIAFNQAVTSFVRTPATSTVILRDGSITSASANGLTMPFGGTVDGITYQGSDGTLFNLGSTTTTRNTVYVNLVTGIVVSADQFIGERGAMIDLSGGGNLTGAGFISGRGGSVDVLTTALANANPANAAFSAAGNKVYAILPGYASAYAPATNSAADPAIGQQVTVQAGVPGLPAGTYTLLPASYALLPGAFRVELGGGTTNALAPTAMANGSYIATGELGVANTGIVDSLPTQLVITSGQVVRTYSQYNEMSYSDFARSQASLFGGVRPRLPVDGKILSIALGPSTGSNSLSFAGTALFGPADDGVGGSLDITATQGILDITAPGATPVVGHTSVSSDALNAFKASTLLIGGSSEYVENPSDGTGSRVYFLGSSIVNVLDGAALQAGQVFLIGSSINVSGGAVIDTRSQAGNGLDSSLGYVFGSQGQTFDPAVLAVANGWLNFLPLAGSGSINVASGATLLTEGSIVLAAPGSLSMGTVNFGARFLTVAQDQINAGTDVSLVAAQAAGVLPAGWNLTQATLDTLLRPSSTSDVPALERLTLTAGGAINFFGSVSLDATSRSDGSPVQFVLNTPAIYGLGGSGDVASITANSFVWNGVRTGDGTGGNPYVSKAPAIVLAGGAGSGQGRLDIRADDILLGYDADSRPTDGAVLDRLALGFSSANLTATKQITANSDGTLSVGQSQDASGALTGGALNLTTPLLAATNGATLDYKAGGAVRVTAPAGMPPADTSAIADLGGTVSFTGDSVLVDTAVALPSGKLTLNATNGIVLGANAMIDLAGRSIAFFDVTTYSWGGDLVMQSAHGDIAQAAGSVIDVSAQNNLAGSITATATDAASGHVTFGGTLKGSAPAGYDSGSITIAAQNLGDFAALNDQLNTAGFFGARAFDLKQGDLVVGNEVKANSVTITTDGGSLTVNGTIDASGAKPGTIRLSARDNLTLASTAVLDAHSNVLQTDSYGAPIEASNTAQVELTSSQGVVTLAGGTTIDLRSADGVARGKLEINAPRLGSTGASATGADAPANATGGDIAISAAAPVTIRGAASIAVNAFASYANAPADPDDANGQLITQGYLDLIDQDSRAFIAAAYNNNVAAGVLSSTLQAKLAGLTAYGNAFHLRPGVQITSAGDLSTKGDLDLSGYRYGPNADPAIRGSGEPGVLVIRAAGDLKINGSINDGFAPPPNSPDSLTVLTSGSLGADYTVQTSGAVLGAGSSLPSTGIIAIDLPLPANFKIVRNPTAAHPIPFDIKLAKPLTFLQAPDPLQGTIYASDGVSVLYAPGAVIPSNTTIPAGSIIGAGNYNLRLSAFAALVPDLTFLPAWKANADRFLLGTYTFAQPTPIAIGTVLPAGMNVTSLTAPGDRQVWAIAPMLAPGSQSWSMRLVGGADLASADSRTLQSVTSLAGSGNVVLNDPFNIDLVGTGSPSAGVSVIRTGTGDLEILAGGDYRQDSPFGVYTAGTAIFATGTAANDPYNVGRGLMPDGTVLGDGNSAYAATINAQRTYYTEHGGDLLLSAQGDIGGKVTPDSTSVGDWLWRQGGAGINQATAWGINFGSYVADFSDDGTPHLGLAAFAGVGALGGGNVTLTAGRDIGGAGQGIVVAIGGSGRVMSDGSLVQTGGGTLSVTAGRNVGTGGNQFVNLRGDTDVASGSFGTLTSTNFGYSSSDIDPRQLNSLIPYGMTAVAGGSFAPGDGTVAIRTRSDLALGTIDDPGRVGLRQDTAASTGSDSGSGATSFVLWTDKTAIDLFAAGGDVSPLSVDQGSGGGLSTLFLPSILRAVAPGGGIYLTTGENGASLMLPSPDGELELLARDRVVETGTGKYSLGPLATSMSSLAMPFNPGWVLRQPAFKWNTIASNYWGDPGNILDGNNWYPYSYDDFFYSTGQGHQGTGGNPFIFGPITVTDDSAAGNGVISRIYAVDGDIINLIYGQIFNSAATINGKPVAIYYRAAKPVQMLAGGDIVNLSGLILQNDPKDISMIAAGGSIIYANVDVAGPGTLEVSAGKNIYGPPREERYGIFCR
jgi:filamentous hemagglutinin family protein